MGFDIHKRSELLYDITRCGDASFDEVSLSLSSLMETFQGMIEAGHGVTALMSVDGVLRSRLYIE